MYEAPDSDNAPNENSELVLLHSNPISRYLHKYIVTLRLKHIHYHIICSEFLMNRLTETYYVCLMIYFHV